MIDVHRAFMQAAQDESMDTVTCYRRIYSATQSLSLLDTSHWPGAAPMYLQLADGRIPKAEKLPQDPFNLLHALCGIVVATRKPMPDRLRETILQMERALKVKLDWQHAQMELSDDSAQAYEAIEKKWREVKSLFDPVLRRYLAMQLSLSFFPFAGLGNTPPERITLIGVRLATIQLAIMCACGMSEAIPPQDNVVRIVQSLSRLLDHLGDAAFSLSIYEEAGWLQENRMGGLLLV